MGNCSRCRYFRDSSDGFGYCLRFPPVHIAEAMQLAVQEELAANPDEGMDWGVIYRSLKNASHFPEVDADSWCGEYVEYVPYQEEAGG